MTRKQGEKTTRVGKAGHESGDYGAVAEAYGVGRRSVAKYVERYRKANGISAPPRTTTIHGTKGSR